VSHILYIYMNNMKKQVLWPSVHHNAIQWKDILKKDVTCCRSKCLLKEMLHEKMVMNYLLERESGYGLLKTM
jgi:hypothetical protein